MQNVPGFKRTIGLYTAISLVIGSVIGSGIFMRPAEMASLLGSPAQILLIWVIGGVLTFLVAMVIAELSSMLPETGGQYYIMQKTYGGFWAFLYGWANFAVINTAGTAGIAFIAAQYFEYFFKLPRFGPDIEHSIVMHLPFIGDIMPLDNFGVKALTAIILCILTFISYRSTKSGGLVQLIFTAAKVLAILFLVGGLFFSPSGSWENFSSSSATIKPMGFALIAAMVAATNGALQSYDGWGNLVYVSGEIKDPQKNIPKSLFIGLIACVGIYMLVTAAMQFMLPVDQMAGSALVASDAAAKAFGTIGGGFIAFLICISVLGTTNASVLTAPRMTYAMAHEKKFFAFAGKEHPEFNTPGNALLLHLVWMVIMVFSGSFYILADMYIFVTWLFNLLLITGVFILRKKMPDAHRPYRVWGYPWIPAIALLCTAFYLGMTLYTDINAYNSGKSHIINSVFGIALTLAGVPFYLYFLWKYRSVKEKNG